MTVSGPAASAVADGMAGSVDPNAPGERHGTADHAAARRRWRRRLGGCALAAIATLALAAALARLAVSTEDALRELRIREQRLERRALVLSAPGTAATLAALAEGRDALRVRLVEAIDAAHGGSGVYRLRHRIEEHRLDEAGDAALLRVALEGRLAHAAALIDLLVAVETAARPWPVETRACHVQRQDGAGLLVDCTLDVLHWKDLRAPRAG